MNKIVCNPMNLPYKYNFQQMNMPALGTGQPTVYREAADPTLVLFKGRHYLFPSMTAGFFVSDDMANWEFHELADPIPVFDYAPDVRAVGDYLYFCASRRTENCSFYRTKDPLTEAFEEIPGSFPFWDPDLFQDDDGRLYLYWGCSNVTPIWGVELDPDTMLPIGEKQVMFTMDNKSRGYERIGMDHVSPKAGLDIDAIAEGIFQDLMKIPQIEREKEGMFTEADVRRLARGFAGDDPYIEGAYVTKRDGKYYLQYAFPATQCNVYGDGVLIADKPLGPYTFARNNPFSYKPGGFINGAGHGSTIADSKGRYWHTASMSISVNNDMERRLGLWKVDFDENGEMYCDQRFGDWPYDVDSPIFEEPPYMLLSYGKNVTVSSGSGAEKVTNECARDWWRADSMTAWCQIDLEEEKDIRGIQVNFADEGIEEWIPEGATYAAGQEIRYIDREKRRNRWILEGSLDGESYFVIEDKSEAETDLCNDFIHRPEGIRARFVRLQILEVPFGQPAAISGLRVFGKGHGPLPAPTKGVTVEKVSEIDMIVSWEQDDAVGHNILWGYEPDKLYHSYMVLGANSKKIGALVKGQPVYVRVDSFNENGVSNGDGVFTPVLCP